MLSQSLVVLKARRQRASVPLGTVNFTTDNTGYAPAVYVADPGQRIRGLSPLHDSGTGSSLGTSLQDSYYRPDNGLSYDNFETMPLLWPKRFETCTALSDDRMRHHKNLMRPLDTLHKPLIMKQDGGHCYQKDWTCQDTESRISCLTWPTIFLGVGVEAVRVPILMQE